MTTAMTAARTRFARTHAQGLAGSRAERVADAVRRVVALQGQDIRANRLAVRVRTEGLTQADVDGACNEERSVVRTWAMRGTLHMLAAEDAGWIVRLLGTRFAALTRPRRVQLGLDDDVAARGVDCLRELLAGGKYLSRAEIMPQLTALGVPLPEKGQAAAHLLSFAAMTGVICRAADDGGEPTYALLEEWAGPSEVLPEETAVARLATRYLTGYGPATAEDFAAWSGLPLVPSRATFASISGQLREVSAAGETAYVLDEPVAEGEPSVRLLGHFDTYLLGYRSRETMLPAKYDKRIQSGGGFIMPAVLVDGAVVGTWRHVRRRENKADLLVVHLEPFTAFTKRALRGAAKEVADIGRFLGVNARLAE